MWETTVTGIGPNRVFTFKNGECAIKISLAVLKGMNDVYET